MNRGIGLIHLRAEILVLQRHQQVSRLNRLIVGDRHGSHQPRNLRTQWRDVRMNIGVIGLLCLALTSTSSPVGGQEKNQSGGEAKDGNGDKPATNLWASRKSHVGFSN